MGFAVVIAFDGGFPRSDWRNTTGPPTPRTAGAEEHSKRSGELSGLSLRLKRRGNCAMSGELSRRTKLRVSESDIQKAQRVGELY